MTMIRFDGHIVRVLLMASLWLSSGCGERGSMIDQPKHEPFEASPFFADGASARPRIEGTVPRTSDPAFAPDQSAIGQRPRLDERLLRAGAEKFDIYCSMCHGRDGYGEGMVVQRGFPDAASFHTDRLRALPDEHIVRVIGNGFRNMPAYRSQIAVRDRWAIAAYVRALQWSQSFDVDVMPAEERGRIEEARTP